METVYKTFDGMTFETPEDAFEYEWREHYPNIQMFSLDGNAFSTLEENNELFFVAKVNNPEEKKFICDYLRCVYGVIDFHDLYQNMNPEPSGYILSIKEEIDYITRENVIAYYDGALNRDSDLAYELSII